MKHVVLATLLLVGYGLTLPTHKAEAVSCSDFSTQEDAQVGMSQLVSGENRQDKAAKVVHAREFWVPAVNNHGGFGRWAFLEITDPWDAEPTIRAILQTQKESSQ